MWRGLVIYFSINTRSSPKAALASRMAAASAASKSAWRSTRHAFTAAAGNSLDQHRISDLIGFLFEEFRLLHVAVKARHHRHARLLHQGFCAILQPHGANR